MVLDMALSQSQNPEKHSRAIAIRYYCHDDAVCIQSTFTIDIVAVVSPLGIDERAPSGCRSIRSVASSHGVTGALPHFASTQGHADVHHSCTRAQCHVRDSSEVGLHATADAPGSAKKP